MHVLARNGHDVDIREETPVYEMALIAKEAPVEAELGQDGFRYDTVGCEQAGDVCLGFLVTPPVPRVTVNIIEAMGCTFPDADNGHRVSPDSAR